MRAFTWLGHVQAGFGQWALPSTRDTAGYWARLCAQSEATGKPMAAFDSLIAATAGSIALFLSRKPAWLSMQRYLMGSVLTGLALRMAMEARK